VSGRRGGRLPIASPPLDRRPLGGACAGSCRCTLVLVVIAAAFVFIIQPRQEVIHVRVERAITAATSTRTAGRRAS